jgi:hypothetical protein
MQRAPFLQTNGHARMSALMAQCKPNTYYFTFAFVRNPYDRLRSNFYAYRQHNQPHSPPPLGKSFKEFVRNLWDDPSLLDKHPHLRPMIWWLDLEPMFIGRFENLHEDWERVCDSIAHPVWKLPHIHMTHRKNESEDFDEPTRQIIWSLYREDFAAFNYPRA